MVHPAIEPTGLNRHNDPTTPQPIRAPKTPGSPLGVYSLKRLAWQMVPQPLLRAWNSPRARTENATDFEPKSTDPRPSERLRGFGWPWLSGKFARSQPE